MRFVRSIFLTSVFFGISALAQDVASNTNAPPPWIASPYAVPQTDKGLPGAGPIVREEWFEQLWVLRRSQWAEQIQQDQGALVFLGDAITQTWGDKMGGNFPGLKVANRGISGDTSRGALVRLKQDVLTIHPSGVVLLIGSEDVALGVDPGVIAGNVKLILTDIERSYPRIPLILCQVFPSSAAKKRPTGVVQKVNQLLAAAVQGDPHVAMVETWKLFANPRGDATLEELPDSLHPNKAGYAKWAAALRPILATYGFMDTEADQWTPEAGFVSLFNGHDLTGWGYVTNNFDGKTNSVEGRYLARNGRLIALTPTNYSQPMTLWTTREFAKDFTLRLEFRAMPYAESGIFIRKPKLACSDYVLSGPYRNLKQYKAQDWNEIEIAVTNNFARCTCNGAVLEAAIPLPAAGAIGLGADRGQIEYRHICYAEKQ
jgi:lysophospholipase L1-like esterase